jgi:hypothetical protein
VQVHVVQLTLPEDEVRKRLLAALAVTDANASESSVDVSGWEALVKSTQEVQGSSIPEVCCLAGGQHACVVVGWAM